MTRLELLTLIVGRARTNGFAFRHWYTLRLGLPWISAEASLALLDAQRRYYALVFSHEFAMSFWKAGTEITFDVPAQTFTRTMPDGTVRTIQRRTFLRRSVRPNAWRYHLRQMALSDEPLRYLRKYLRVEDELESALETEKQEPQRKLPSSSKSAQSLTPSADLPAFLKRPYASNSAAVPPSSAVGRALRQSR